MTGKRKRMRIVVEGVGDVVSKYYEPAFKALLGRNPSGPEIHVTFADKSEFWSSDPKLAGKMQGIIRSIESWGADYLDKSKPAEMEKYRDLNADAVIVATPDSTHVEITESWLAHQPPPGQIFIEKPLADSLNSARKLLGLTGPKCKLVLAFDHYRARLLPSRYQMDTLLGFWGGGLRRFQFYFLEDHSGADPHYGDAQKVGRDGAVENEQRVKTLRQGVILDGMPHAIAILAHFCRVETMLVTKIRAGQYVGVDGDPDKRTEIEKETFAEIQFVCEDYGLNQVEGAFYVGKGVHGVKSLGPEFNHNVKVLDVEGLNGAKTRFDLRSSGQGASRAYLIDKDGAVQFEFRLYSNPYEFFLQKIFDGTYHHKPTLALSVEVGKRILEVLEDMRYPIHDKDSIPPYPSGMKGVRQSLYLEEILDRLPVLFGR